MENQIPPQKSQLITRPLPTTQSPQNKLHDHDDHKFELTERDNPYHSYLRNTFQDIPFNPQKYIRFSFGILPKAQRSSLQTLVGFNLSLMEPSRADEGGSIPLINKSESKIRRCRTCKAFLSKYCKVESCNPRSNPELLLDGDVGFVKRRITTACFISRKRSEIWMSTILL